MKIIFLIGLLALGGIFGTSYGLSNNIDFSKCHPACFEFVPTHESQDAGHQVIDFTHNQDFIVIMADGSCNIDGTFNQATNTCSAHSLILTPTDFKKFQNNVASMYVGNIYSTDDNKTINYCTLAAWTWMHQTPEFQAKYDINKVIPSECFTSTPDFTPSVAAIVFMLSVVFITVLSKRG